MNTAPLIVERVIHAPASLVWQAITDVDHMRKWYFDLKDFKPEVGCEFTFDGTSDEKTYTHLCKITDVEYERKLRYSWSYPDYEGMSYVTFELIPEGENTRLKLTHEGLHTFPPTKDLGRDSFTAGWNEIIGKLLPDYVEGLHTAADR